VVVLLQRNDLLDHVRRVLHLPRVRRRRRRLPRQLWLWPGYRQALSHLCGIADAEDRITVAHWLADCGRADRTHVISGASAGGFTALRALIFSDVFAAASCVSGIVDLLEFHRRTHKFQRHELDRLVGPLPERLPSYESRSPSNLVDEIDRPIFLGARPR
jgi:dipeptidyl aminopeptidase/acylaminoacyl peptidase